MNIKEIRDQFPQYADLSDDQVARSLHTKHYSDIPYQQFALQIGVIPNQPASRHKRFGMGGLEQVVGLGQVAARPLAAAGKVIPDPVGSYLQRTPEAADKAAADLDQWQEQNAPEGLNWARMAGSAAVVAPAAFVSAPAALTARAGQLAYQGTVAGGVSGASTPVQNTNNFGLTKTVQVGGGAALGALLTPIADKVIGGISQMVGRGVNALKRQPPQINVDVHINQAIREAGLDPRQFPAAAREEIRQQVMRAMNTGGQVNNTAVANRAAFETVGARPTRGELTQDPTQYGQEMFLRNQSGGRQLASNYQDTLGALNARLGDLQRGTAPPMNNPDAGRVIQTTLGAADARGKNVVDRLYNQARQSVGLNAQWDGRAFADSTMQRLDDQMIGDKLPAPMRAVLNQISTGRFPTTVQKSEQLVRAINGRIGSSSDRQEILALNVMKDELLNAEHSVASQAGREAAEAFTLARQAARQRFEIHDAIPSLKAVADGEMVPDDFMRRFVGGASRDELVQLRNFLGRADRGSWQQIRGQVLNDIRTAAGADGESRFSQAGFNRAMQGLERSGKLPVLFNAQEINMLRSIGRVGRAVQEGPPGVSRTGMGGAARAMDMFGKLLQRLPVLGRGAALAGDAIAAGGTAVRAQAALSPAPVAQSGNLEILSPMYRNALARGAGAAALGYTPGL